MTVRVYDRATDSCFYSSVYALVNMGWYERRLVHVPCRGGDCLRFHDYLDREAKPAKVLINTITPSPHPEWIRKESGVAGKTLEEYARALGSGVRFSRYAGPAWLYDAVETLARLLAGESIPVRGSIFEDRLEDWRQSGWNHIETQGDIDTLMETAAGFHDSILRSLDYVSGGYISEGRWMHPVDDVRRVTMVIDSQISNPIEMVFEGVTALNLRPSADNKSSEILSASLFIQDCTVYFCDNEVPAFDTSYAGTWITAYSLRWRLLSGYHELQGI